MSKRKSDTNETSNKKLKTKPVPTGVFDRDRTDDESTDDEQKETNSLNKTGWPKKQTLRIPICGGLENQDGFDAEAVNVQVVYSNQEAYNCYHDEFYSALLPLIAEINPDGDFDFDDVEKGILVDCTTIDQDISTHVFVDDNGFYWYKDREDLVSTITINLVPLNIDDVEFESKPLNSGQSPQRNICCECSCEDYPSCTIGDEACENCIDGSDGHHYKLKDDGTSIKCH